MKMQVESEEVLKVGQTVSLCRSIGRRKEWLSHNSSPFRSPSHRLHSPNLPCWGCIDGLGRGKCQNIARKTWWKVATSKTGT